RQAHGQLGEQVVIRDGEREVETVPEQCILHGVLTSKSEHAYINLLVYMRSESKKRPSPTGAHASVHGPCLVGPVTFTQHPLEDLARATLRQLGVQELNPAWELVIGERAPAVCRQIIRTEDLSRLQHDTGHHELTPLGVGCSEYGGFTN